ncbi:WD40 repeat domain-containing protein [Nonomuraea jiangxiensis]|uniref:WD40 repeat domain-containing protein n=1 Tax=Nonomuraea jiangxiensis TaxID=633440 RepID=UPI000B8251E1
MRAGRGSISEVAFTPDGQWLAGNGSDTVRFWPVSGDTEPVIYRGFDAGVERMAIGPNGRVATGHTDGTVRIWTCQVSVLHPAVLSGTAARPVGVRHHRRRRDRSRAR